MKPFHQIERYQLAKTAIDAMREKEQHTILEVGSGSHANLLEFLPTDRITFLDLELSPEVENDPRFVTGDATALEYDENSFDFVIGLDVLEHIPPEKRDAFMSNVCRVARLGLFLSFPQGINDEEYTEDAKLEQLYLAEKNDPPVWIQEHISSPLPKAADILQKATSLEPNASIYSFYGVRKTLMTKMLYVEALSSKYRSIENLLNIINTKYQKDILFHDFPNDYRKATKSYIVIDKRPDRKDLSNLINRHFAPDEAIVDEFEKEVTNLISWYLLIELANSQLDHDNISSKRFDVLNGKEDIIISRNYELLQEKQEIQQKLDILLNKREIPVLDVILITYNQSKYIKETLNSLLMQHVNFPVRVIVADDCSTDNTVDIIKELSSGSDFEFVFLHSDHNLGIMKNYKRAFASCSAEFVAILEGDDLWTDPLRLQKHVDFLRNHSECSMSFNRYIVKDFDAGTTRLQPVLSPEDSKKAFSYITGHDLAYDNLIGNFSTCVYRLSSLIALPEQFFDMKAYDWLLNILISKMGYIGCLMQPTSIYRIHKSGVWSGQDEEQRTQDLIQTIDEYNKYTNYEFNDGFIAHQNRLKDTLMQNRVLNAIDTVLPKKSGIETTKTTVVRLLKLGYKCLQYLPPIFTELLKLLIPKALSNKMISKL